MNYLNEQKRYWRKGALEDIEVSKELLNLKRHLHCLFYATLSLEKALKYQIIIETKYVQKVYKQDKNVLKAYLFGSYSRNEQRRWSDIDICLVYKDLYRDYDGITTKIWMIRDHTHARESFIQPIIIDKTDFRKGVPLPYIIKEEGIPLPLT